MKQEIMIQLSPQQMEASSTVANTSPGEFVFQNLAVRRIMPNFAEKFSQWEREGSI